MGFVQTEGPNQDHTFNESLGLIMNSGSRFTITRATIFCLISTKVFRIKFNSFCNSGSSKWCISPNKSPENTGYSYHLDKSQFQDRTWQNIQKPVFILSEASIIKSPGSTPSEILIVFSIWSITNSRFRLYQVFSCYYDGFKY